MNIQPQISKFCMDFLFYYKLLGPIVFDHCAPVAKLGMSCPQCYSDEIVGLLAFIFVCNLNIYTNL